MFAICLSFLIFAGSTFKLIGKLILSSLEARIGADLYAGTIDIRSMNTFVELNSGSVDGARSLLVEKPFVNTVRVEDMVAHWKLAD